MSLAGRFDWRWAGQPEPAPARAVVAFGPAARRLHARLQLMSAEEQARLHATASRDVMVVSGATAALPWIDGAAYAAPCPEAPNLWLPTLRRPDVACDLLAIALDRRHQRKPLLLWPDPSVLVPMDRQLPVSAALLARIAALWDDQPGAAA
ncbi:bpX5 domain-containing protein [Piscinibacter terrae]|uniref:MoxR-vWA-beta-propeller ternary system domain-containing protein n=1 Tax=Piscinibacter terrae TaxID=2496871 RepID=A0A3N7HK87_9BURK|nr:hypothetical protein [Albitalea terrae]RQP22490.1 hypothetical protein DZC73_22880 [Albitalea terrae]